MPESPSRPRRKPRDRYHHGDLRRALLDEALRTIQKEGVEALTLELHAKGGHAYLEQEQDGFARRWREAAFIPVITPSITQLQAALARHAASAK